MKSITKKIISPGILLLITLPLTMVQTACSQSRDWVPEDTEFYEPVPPVLESAPVFQEAPSDAIILFDGTDLSAWESIQGGDAEWDLDDGILTVNPGTGNIVTKDHFGSVQLYLEWKSPEVIDGDGQGRGNSGVFLQRRYEIQVLDMYENETYTNGMAASIYKQHVPYANVASPRGEWNTYNIIYEAPEFRKNGSVKKPAYITVFWNGVLVQHKAEVQGTTEYIGPPSYTMHEEDGIELQDHSDRVSFRNIWLRKLDESPVRQ